MNQQWQNLNRMPAVFRKKTTDEHILKHKKLVAAFKLQDPIHRDDTDLKKHMEDSKYALILENAKYDQYTYSTLDGQGYLNRLGALNWFKNICRTGTDDLAAQVVTVWLDNTWKPLNEAYATLIAID